MEASQHWRQCSIQLPLRLTVLETYLFHSFSSYRRFQPVGLSYPLQEMAPTFSRATEGLLCKQVCKTSSHSLWMATEISLLPTRAIIASARSTRVGISKQ